MYTANSVKAAHRIFNSFHTRNTERIAKNLEIMIVPCNFKSQKGVYKIIERNPIIFIKENLHPAMRSIVLGHEIGHHILHRAEAISQGGFQEFNLFEMRESRLEYEANLFAAELMLSDDDILDMIHLGYDVAQIAKAMHSDINLVALKIAELNRRGFSFREQNYKNNFLK